MTAMPPLEIVPGATPLDLAHMIEMSPEAYPFVMAVRGTPGTDKEIVLAISGFPYRSVLSALEHAAASLRSHVERSGW